MTYETLVVSQDASLATITLNRPDVMNAFSPHMLTELHGALERLESLSDVRCIVITGSGRGFCAGADLSVTKLDQDFEAFLITYYHPVIETIYHLKKPVIAAVNGVAAGAGMSLAMACDLRLVSSEAVFTTAFSRIGLTLDAGGSYFLAKLVGRARAFDLSYTSRKVSAEEALSMGLADYVFDAGSFDASVLTFVLKLANGPSKAFGFIKEQINAESGNSLAEHLKLEAKRQDEASKTSDFNEGVAAFLDKRTPDFKGD